MRFLTDNIKALAREQKALYLESKTTDFEVSRSEFDLGLIGGVFRRATVDKIKVFVCWVNTGEIQVRVSVGTD